MPFAPNHKEAEIESIQGYSEACKLGRKHAQMFVAWVKAQPHQVGNNWIGQILQGGSDGAEKQGYVAGFCAQLERSLVFGIKTV